MVCYVNKGLNEFYFVGASSNEKLNRKINHFPADPNEMIINKQIHTMDVKDLFSYFL